MILYTILGIVVACTVVVLGALFFMLSKEGQNKAAPAVPMTDLAELKKELSNQLFEQNDLRVVEKDSEIIPVFEHKITVPPEELQPATPSPEDEAYKKRAQSLEDELLAISKKAAGRSDEDSQLIAELTKENETLKSLQEEASNLKTTNISLQTQVAAANTKARQLEEEIEHINAAVADLNREKEALLSAPKPPSDDTLRQELEELKKKQQELSDTIAQLTEKNGLLEYELVKAKAQSSGLERVSFNYKNQLEDFFKKMDAIQVSNDQLSQVKNRLEGMVEEVKLQNEDLVKKDQLAQFELEKNRSRLQSLEREYEDLKARLQQQGQQ